MSEYKLFSVVNCQGFVLRCNATEEEAYEWIAAKAGDGVYSVIEQKPVAPVVQADASGEPSLKRFLEYLRDRAAESKVFRDKAAKEWRYGDAQQHQVAIDIFDELAEYILSGDAKKELTCRTT